MDYYTRKRNARIKAEKREKLLNSIYSFIIAVLACYGYLDILLRANGL